MGPDLQSLLIYAQTRDTWKLYLHEDGNFMPHVVEMLRFDKIHPGQVLYGVYVTHVKYNHTGQWSIYGWTLRGRVPQGNAVRDWEMGNVQAVTESTARFP